MANYLTDTPQTTLNATNNSSAIVEGNNSTVAPVKQVNSTTPKTQKTAKPVQTASSQLIGTVKAHHLAQVYMDSHYGKGYSVAYGALEDGEYNTIFYDSNANYAGNIIVDAYDGHIYNVIWNNG
jgi:hypothetical protein